MRWIVPIAILALNAAWNAMTVAPSAEQTHLTGQIILLVLFFASLIPAIRSSISK